jgi:hypothetical protein
MLGIVRQTRLAVRGRRGVGANRPTVQAEDAAAAAGGFDLQGAAADGIPW